MKNKLIAIAEGYKFITRAELPALMEFYNSNCFPLVKPSRRYRIQRGNNWCAMFVSVVAFKAGLAPDRFPFEVSVMEQVKLAKERNSFTTNYKEVERGDLIIFDWNGNGWANHVGFIDKIDPNLVTTIEGNYQSTVRNRTIATASKSIMGFIKLGGF